MVLSAYLSSAKLYHRSSWGRDCYEELSPVLLSNAVQDEKLWKHFTTIGVDAQIYAWGLLRSIFTEALSRCCMNWLCLLSFAGYIVHGVLFCRNL